MSHWPRWMRGARLQFCLIRTDYKPNWTDFRTSGIAYITPSSVTGQEENKQARALAFTEVLLEARQNLKVMSVPQTLRAINRMGLARDYRQMFEDYRLAGLFNREALQKVAARNLVAHLP